LLLLLLLLRHPFLLLSCPLGLKWGSCEPAIKEPVNLAHLHCLLLRLLLIWVECRELRLHSELRLQSVILALQIDQVVAPKGVDFGYG
jgi:hypothetical protein